MNPEVGEQVGEKSQIENLRENMRLYERQKKKEIIFERLRLYKRKEHELRIDECASAVWITSWMRHV